MDIKALIEKRNKLMVDAQAVITKETVTAEDRTNFDRMIADADVLSADITRMQSVENFNTAVTENDPTVAGFQSFTDTATSGLVSISNQLLQDSQFDLDSWIQNKLAGRYYRGFANWISLGNGSNVTALGSTLGATSASPTAVVYNDLVSLYGSLDNLYVQNASWVMSSATRASLMGPD